MAEQYSYCVVEDILSDEFDADGLPIPTGRVHILFDGGFDKESCHKWMEEHPEQCTTPSVRVMPFPEYPW
jgi:hypothetical protein